MGLTSSKKILCTIGPASMNDRVIARLTALGVYLFRINLSHTRLEDLERVIDFIQKRTSIPICLDTEGAQIRTGHLNAGEVLLKVNERVQIAKTRMAGNQTCFNLYPGNVTELLEVGDLISIDFNSVLVRVVEKNDDGLIGLVSVGGLIGQNKAVSTDREIMLPALTEKDVESLAIGMAKGIKHVALSFANHERDIKEIRSYVHKETYVISKIESINGVQNVIAIAKQSDALLIDRGDLSREVPIEQIPRLQKEIIQQAKKSGVQIFVATNLLESMTKSASPSRAEVNDIFNTLIDGADGLVLASETAVGLYPVQCAVMTSRILDQFEDFQLRGNCLSRSLRREESLFLAPPHGGALIDRRRFDLYDLREKYERLIVSEKDLLNIQHIAFGSFSPLEGFMKKVEVDSVLQDFRLLNGVIWPVPVMLPVKENIARQMRRGQRIILQLEDDDTVYGFLDIEDIYKYNLRQFAESLISNNDRKYSCVQELLDGGPNFLGGKITLINRMQAGNRYPQMNPRQSRKIFEHKGWTRIIGVDERHDTYEQLEHLQSVAFDEYYCDGILMPELSNSNQDSEKWERIIFATIHDPFKCAGLRQTIFRALCYKNYGCSHFMVGRENLEFESYFEKDARQKIFDILGEIGIEPIFLNEREILTAVKK